MDLARTLRIVESVEHYEVPEALFNWNRPGDLSGQSTTARAADMKHPLRSTCAHSSIITASETVAVAELNTTTSFSDGAVGDASRGSRFRRDRCRKICALASDGGYFLGGIMVCGGVY